MAQPDFTEDNGHEPEAETGFEEAAVPMGTAQSFGDFPDVSDTPAVPEGGPVPVDDEYAAPVVPRKKGKGLLIGGALLAIAAAGGGIGAWQYGLFGGAAEPPKLAGLGGTPTPNPNPVHPAPVEPTPVTVGDGSTTPPAEPMETASAENTAVTPNPTETTPNPVTPTPTVPTPNPVTPAAPPVAHVAIPKLEELGSTDADRVAKIRSVMDELGKSSPKAADLQQCLDLIQKLKADVQDDQLNLQLRSWERTLEIVLRQITRFAPALHVDRPQHVALTSGTSHIGHPVLFVAAAVCMANDTPFPHPTVFPPADDKWQNIEADWNTAEFQTLWPIESSPDRQADLLVDAAQWLLDKNYHSLSQFYISEATHRIASPTSNTLDQLVRAATRARIDALSARISLALLTEIEETRKSLKTASESIQKLQAASQETAFAAARKYFTEPSLVDRWQKLNPAENMDLSEAERQALTADWEAKSSRLKAIQTLIDNAPADQPPAGIELAAADLADIAAQAALWERDRAVAAQLKTKFSLTQFNDEFLKQLRAQLDKDGLLSSWTTLKPWADQKPTDFAKAKDLDAATDKAVETYVKKLFDNQNPQDPSTLLALAKRLENVEEKGKSLEGKDKSLDEQDKQLAMRIAAAIKQAHDELIAAQDASKIELTAADKLEQNRIDQAKMALQMEIAKSLNSPRPLPNNQLSVVASQVSDAVKMMLFGWGYVPPSAPPLAASMSTVTPDPQQALACFQIGYQRYFQKGEDAEREAIRELSLACELDPDNVNYAYFLALAHYRAGDTESAAVQARHAATLEMQAGYSDLPRRLERVQYGPRRWLERVRETVRLAANK